MFYAPANGKNLVEELMNERDSNFKRNIKRNKGLNRLMSDCAFNDYICGEKIMGSSEKDI